MATTDHLLNHLISVNQPPNQTLKVVSEDSLYSYVFKMTDTNTRKVYAIKLIPMGHLPKSDVDSESQEESQEVQLYDIKKKTTPNDRRIEKELEYLHHFSGIGPHPESVTISTDYNSIIDELLNTTTDPVTIKTLERIRRLLNHIRSQGFINVKLACIIMEFIPGQTLWEVQQKLGLSQTDASMSLLIVTMSQIIDLLFTHGYVLIDCHQKNVQISKSRDPSEAVCRASAQAPTNKVLNFLKENPFRVVLLDFGDAYLRTEMYNSDAFINKEAFINKVKDRVAHALWLEYDDDDDVWKKSEDFLKDIPPKSIALMEKLITSDDFISLSEIQDINDLRVVLAIIRETSEQYSWMGGLINNGKFLNTLLIYLKEEATIRREEALQRIDGYQKAKKIRTEKDALVGDERLVEDETTLVEAERQIAIEKAKASKETKKRNLGGKRKTKKKSKTKKKYKTKRKTKSKTKFY